MASVTYAQAKKWDETAKKYGDFRFDVRYYVLWSEKALIKHVENADGTITEYKIRYSSDFIREGGEVREMHVPTYIINRLVPTSTEGVYSVREEHREALAEGTAKKSYNTLCKLSAGIKLEGVA